MNSSFRNSLNAGFTLIEVMIAMAILAFISLAIYQLTVETYRLRDTLSSEGDFYNGVRLSMDVMQRDVALIYSPLLIQPGKTSTPSPSAPGTPQNPNPQALPPAMNPQDLEVINAAGLGQATKYWGPATDKTGVRPSRFQGTDQKMSFISASHVRVYRDAAESEFAKIGYELKQDDDPANQGSYVLVKTESPNAFEDDDSRDKSVINYPLLHGVKKLKYRYYRKDKETWESSWDSEKEDTKNLYPDMVEITIELAGPSNLHYQGVYRFRPEVPLYGIDPST